MIVFLAGPVDWWWHENWHTAQHYSYMNWRQHINDMLVEAGHLVYRPHESFKGAWNEVAQAVNDRALEICEVFIYLTPPDVPAYGTEAETEKARGLGLRIAHVPPGDTSQINDLIVPLKDPYGDVHRKSYSKESNDSDKV